MSSTRKVMMIAGMIATAVVAIGATRAHAAGCCGGGRAVGVRGAAPASCCASMAGMSMPGMAMPAAQPAPQYAPQPVAVAPTSAPAPAARVAGAASYTCPMHPGVVSGAPGACPICHMALTRRS